MREQIIAEVSIVPLGTASPSVSQYVAGCHKVLKKAEGISYQLNPMGTIIQGPLGRVLEVISTIEGTSYRLWTTRYKQCSNRRADIESQPS
jgi:uncharacterized protein (TIGR00106 family)